MRLDETQCRIAHQAASLLLAYPDEDLVTSLPTVQGVLDEMAEPVGGLLRRTADHLASTPLSRLAADYVETFDLRRRCCLYLTYYSCGDTRRRGTAMLRFTQAYRAAGAPYAGVELPDHLAVVLEFSGCGHPVEAIRLLREHQAGLELLCRALDEAGSPYLPVVEAVRLTLPPPGRRVLDTALRLAREGPPREEVGLEGPSLAPYGPAAEPLGGRR